MRVREGHTSYVGQKSGAVRVAGERSMHAGLCIHLLYAAWIQVI